MTRVPLGAGWKRTGDGPRTKDGKTLSTVITTYDADQAAIATAAVDMLRAVGFDAKVLDNDLFDPIRGITHVWPLFLWEG